MGEVTVSGRMASSLCYTVRQEQQWSKSGPHRSLYISYPSPPRDLCLGPMSWLLHEGYLCLYAHLWFLTSSFYDLDLTLVVVHWDSFILLFSLLFSPCFFMSVDSTSAILPYLKTKICRGKICWLLETEKPRPQFSLFDFLQYFAGILHHKHHIFMTYNSFPIISVTGIMKKCKNKNKKQKVWLQNSSLTAAFALDQILPLKQILPEGLTQWIEHDSVKQNSVPNSWFSINE